MKSPLTKRLPSWSLMAVLLCVCHTCAQAEPIPVRHVAGTIHGFLQLRSEAGSILASGDLVQTVRGDQVTSRTTFNFKDGSLDDETTVFSQRRNLHLISDHRIQKGPSFPHPMDLTIDARSGQVTARFTDKDGKEQVNTSHIVLPPDIANGMVPVIIENLRPGSAETDVSMLVATPKPRLVKLAISPLGEEPFSVAGASRKAVHYEIKIQLGGVAGVVAPFIGKQPPNIQIWIVGGDAPTFLREQGPLYPEGPVFAIELASPVWPDAQRSGN